MPGIKAPGKIMLSGEWSVLELGNPCIVLALDRFVEVRIKKAKEICINAPDFRVKKTYAKFDAQSCKLSLLNADSGKEKTLSFVKNSIEASLAYLGQKKVKVKNFEITTKSKDTIASTPAGEQKIGFGSSAAVSAATVAAVLKLHGLKIKSPAEKERIFKLSCIAHFLGQGKIGSAFDVAASTFGGALVYRRFDGKWLEQEMKKKGIAEVVEQGWPKLYFEPLKLPKDFEIVVGFTGKSASTKELVMKVNEFKESERLQYNELMQEIRETTQKLVVALKKNRVDEVLGLIRENRRLLKDLSDASLAELETPELTKIIEAAESNNGAGKFSGAGGGDCAIAVCFSKKDAGKIRQAIKQRNLFPVEVKISDKGVSEM